MSAIGPLNVLQTNGSKYRDNLKSRGNYTGCLKKGSHILIAGSIYQNKKKNVINMGAKTNTSKDTSYFLF